MRSDGLLDGRRAHVTVGLPSIHVGKDGLCGRVNIFTSCSCTSGEEGERRPRVNFPCGPEIPRVKLIPDRLFWRTPGKSGSDPAQSSLSEAEMDMESSPSSWPKDTNSSMLAGAEAVLGDGNRGMGRPLDLAARRDGPHPE